MTQNPSYDVCAVGNAIVDVLAPCDPAFLTAQGLTPGSMQLVDARQSAALYAGLLHATRSVCVMMDGDGLL